MVSLREGNSMIKGCHFWWTINLQNHRGPALDPTGWSLWCGIPTWCGGRSTTRCLRPMAKELSKRRRVCWFFCRTWNSFWWLKYLDTILLISVDCRIPVPVESEYDFLFHPSWLFRFLQHIMFRIIIACSSNLGWWSRNFRDFVYPIEANWTK